MRLLSFVEVGSIQLRELNRRNWLSLILWSNDSIWFITLLYEWKISKDEFTIYPTHFNKFFRVRLRSYSLTPLLLGTNVLIFHDSDETSKAPGSMMSILEGSKPLIYLISQNSCRNWKIRKAWVPSNVVNEQRIFRLLHFSKSWLSPFYGMNYGDYRQNYHAIAHQVQLMIQQ